MSQVISFAATTDDTTAIGGTVTQKDARSFVAGVKAISVNASLCIFKNGSPIDNLIISIQADSAGSPSGVDLGSLSITGSTLATSCSVVSAFGSFTVALTSGSTYWLVLSRSGTLGNTNYYVLNVKSTGGPGIQRLISGTWTALANYDFQGSILLTDASNASFLLNMLG